MPSSPTTNNITSRRRVAPLGEPAAEPALLVAREQAATMLGGISVHTLIRMERAGRLRPLRLTRSPSAKVFYKLADIHALVENAATEAGVGK